MKNALNFKWPVFVAMIILTTGCGINRQAKQIKALEDCTYRITGTQQINVAGTDVRKIIQQQTIELSSLPGIALGMLSKNVPLKATLNLEIANPKQQIAAINQFEYKLLIGAQEIADGVVNQAISIGPGQKVMLPVQINSNLYAFFSNSSILDGIVRAVRERKGNESLGELTIKLKPTFMLGKTAVKYPGYITINKTINAGMFL